MITLNKVLEDSSRISGFLIPCYILLIIGKAVKSFALIFTYDLLKSYHIVWILFFITFVTALGLLLIQAPCTPISTAWLRNKRIFWRLIEYSIYLTLIRFLWLYSLMLCGPLRTILLFEHHDLVIVACFHVLFSASMDSSEHTSRVRGFILFICAVATMFLLDTSERAKAQAFDFWDDSLPQDSLAYSFRQLMFLIGGLEHKCGIILILIALSLRYVNYSRYEKLEVDLGGATQVYLISTCLSALFLIPAGLLIVGIDRLLPVSLNSLILTGIPIFQLSTVSFFISLLAIGFGLFVLDFHIEQFLISKLGRRLTLHYGSLSIILSVPIVSLFWIKVTRVIYTSGWFGTNMDNVEDEEGEHLLSSEIILSILLFVFATNLFYSPIKRRTSSLVDDDMDLEEASTMVDTVHDQYDSFTSILPSFVSDMFTRSDSKKILLFIALKMTVIFIEMIYGLSIESFDLINDAYHMVWDCAILFIFLYPMHVAEWSPNRQFSYGYSRIEVLAAYVNGIRLFFLGGSMLYHAVNRLLDPSAIISDRLPAVVIIDLFVNVLGIVLLRHSYQQHFLSGEKPSNPSMAKNLNMQGIYLHVWIGLLTSIAIIISSVIIHYIGWYQSEPICLIFVALLTIIAVCPLIRDSTMFLLLQKPSHLDPRILDQILGIEEVLSYSNEHFWTLSPSNIIGTIHIQITADADEQTIVEKVQKLFHEKQLKQVTIQIEKPEFFTQVPRLTSHRSDHLSSMYNDDVFFP